METDVARQYVTCHRGNPCDVRYAGAHRALIVPGGSCMHILVVSDSHGNTSNLKEAMLRHPEVTRVLHCGDGEADVAALSAAYPSVRFDAVRGNCDLGALLPLQRLLRIAGRRIFMTHGHSYSTKYGVELLLEQGRKERADVVLFGHTHRRPVSYTHLRAHETRHDLV